MTSLITFIASYVVTAAWQLPALCLVGWLTARLVRDLGPAAQHRVWTAVLLLCVVVPALPSPRVHGMGTATVIEQVKVHRSSVTITGSSLAWASHIWVPLWMLQAAAAVWLLTVIYGGARLLLAYRATCNLLASSHPLAEQPLSLQQCRNAFGIGTVDVLRSDAISGPVTLRARGRDILLLPERMLREVAPHDVAAAIAHECAHIRRRDYPTHLLLSILALPVRFHPLVVKIQSQIAATREMACDAAAASLHGPDYRGALLRLAQWIAHASAAKPALAMGFAVGIFDSNSLEDRMNRLLAPAPRIPRSIRTALAVMAIGTMAATASALALHGMHLLPAANAETTSTTDAPAKSKLVMPRLIFSVDPEFPPSERHHGTAEYTCMVSINVDVNGMPQQIHIAHPKNEAFDTNAVKAVSQYRFRPATRNGTPVEEHLNIAVDFRIF